MLPARCKRHPVLTAALAWVLVMTPVGMVAEAAFQLEYDPSVTVTEGLHFLPEVQGLKMTSLIPGTLPTPRPVSAARQAPTRLPGPVSSRCGGDLPPCWVMDRESDGDPNAYNPTGCSGRGCYGKWQCDPQTCDGTGTEAEQDAEARRVWANGRGCSHWAACGGPH
jgi:hypothetical protein